jgi:anti-sigma factor RsiW
MTEERCINPSEIEEGDLIAYLHGEATPHVEEHIAHCAFCAEQVEQLRVIDAQLLTTFYRDACPTADVLAGFILKQLPAAERLRVAAHVRSCSACSEEIAALSGLADDEPPSLLTRLQEALALALVARPVAHAAAAARGLAWQGRFEVENFLVTLSTDAGSLTGRVRIRDAPDDVDCSGQAWLLARDQPAQEAPSSVIDERGRFWFATPPAGSYAVLLQVGEQNVVIEDIQIA